MAEDGAHAAHLALAALGEDDLEPGAAGEGGAGERGRGEPISRARAGRLTVPRPRSTPSRRARRVSAVGEAADPGVVGPGDVVLGIGQAAAEGGVVGEDRGGPRCRGRGGRRGRPTGRRRGATRRRSGAPRVDAGGDERRRACGGPGRSRSLAPRRRRGRPSTRIDVAPRVDGSAGRARPRVPLTLTRPAAIQRSASRREQTPSLERVRPRETGRGRGSARLGAAGQGERHLAFAHDLPVHEGPAP